MAGYSSHRPHVSRILFRDFVRLSRRRVVHSLQYSNRHVGLASSYQRWRTNTHAGILQAWNITATYRPKVRIISRRLQMSGFNMAIS